MWERVQKLIKERGLNVKSVEQKCGFGNASLKKINENSACIRVYELSKLFNVSMEYLLTGRSNSFSENERNILSLYNQLNENGQSKVNDYLYDLVSCGNYKKVAYLDA